MEVNFIAVLVAAFVAFIVGGIWYSPKVFGTLWSKHAGTRKINSRHKPLTFIVAFIFYFVSAWAFAIIVGPDSSLTLALYAGAAIGILFVSMCFGINYLFSGRSVVLLLIDSIYHIVQFLLYGLVLGLWH